MISRRPLLSLALALLAVGLLYVAILSTLPLNGLWSGDQGAKLVQVVSLLRAKFTSLSLGYPEAARDPTGAFSPLPAMYTWPAGGARYSIFSYPYAVLTALPFFALGYPGLYVVPVLATLLTLGLCGLIGARLGLGPAWAVALALALATPLSFYALVFWEHALATCLAVAALLCALRSGEAGARAGRWAFAGGLLAGLAWWLRSEALLVGPALLAGMLWAGASRRSLAAAAAGCALALAPLLIFYALVFGLPLGPQVALNYGVPGTTLASLLQLRLLIAGTLLVGLSHRAWVWYVAWACALALAALPARARPWALLGLAACALGGLLITQPRDTDWSGLANAASLALLAPLGLRLLARRPAARLLGGFAICYAAGVLLSAPNAGGAQWGPRYLLPALPALLLLGLAAARALAAPGAPRRRLAGAALAILLIACVGVQMRGLELLRFSLGNSQRLVQVVNARPARTIVTDSIFGPQLLGPIYYERPILLIGVPERWAELPARLAGAGERGFTYLTDQPRGQLTPPLRALGARCALVEGLAYSLSLFDCELPAPR